MKIKEAVQRGETVTGEEAYNFFLAVLFPANQLLCMEYNRVVRDLAGFTVSSVSLDLRSSLLLRCFVTSLLCFFVKYLFRFFGSYM